MAVESKIVTDNVSGVLASKGYGSNFSGAVKKQVCFNFDVAAADSDGSVYGIAQLPVNAKNVVITQFNDAITAGTDYDIGVYQFNGSDVGTVVDKDCLVDGRDNSSARTTPIVSYDTTVEGFGKKLWQLAGLSAQPAYPTFLVAITANTVGSAAGTIGGFIEYVEG